METKFENILRGPLTSLLGFILMIAAFCAWFIEYLTDWQAGIVGLIGFILLFMRDKLPDFISQFANAVIEVFKNRFQK